MAATSYRFEVDGHQQPGERVSGGNMSGDAVTPTCPAEIRAAQVLTPTFDMKSYVESLSIDETRQIEIATLPQRGPEWESERFGVVSASVAYDASGLGGIAAQRELLRKMVWPQLGVLTDRFALLATSYGNDNEQKNLDVYEMFRRAEGRLGWDGLRVFGTGLLRSTEYPWIGASLDGCVDERTSLEQSEQCSERATEGAVAVGGGDGAPRPAIAAMPEHELHAFEPHTLEAPVRECHAHAPICIMHDGDGGADAFIAVRREACGAIPVDYKPSACGCSCRNAGGVVNLARSATCSWAHGCVEAKCPATGVLYSTRDEHDAHLFPAKYRIQTLVQMFVSKGAFCDASVFTPECTEVVRFIWQQHVWDDLLRRLKAFYFGLLLPTFEMRAKGLLQYGNILPPARPPKNIPRITDILSALRDQRGDDDRGDVGCMSDADATKRKAAPRKRPRSRSSE